MQRSATTVRGAPIVKEASTPEFNNVSSPALDCLKHPLLHLPSTHEIATLSSLLLCWLVDVGWLAEFWFNYTGNGSESKRRLLLAANESAGNASESFTNASESFIYASEGFDRTNYECTRTNEMPPSRCIGGPESKCEIGYGTMTRLLAPSHSPYLLPTHTFTPKSCEPHVLVIVGPMCGICDVGYTIKIGICTQCDPGETVRASRYHIDSSTLTPSRCPQTFMALLPSALCLSTISGEWRACVSAGDNFHGQSQVGPPHLSVHHHVLGLDVYLPSPVQVLHKRPRGAKE